MKKLASSAYVWVTIGLICSVHFSADAQSHRLGAGLSFASPISYNSGETGNPGFSFHYWMPVGNSDVFQVVPSVTVFNPYRLKTGYITLYNYLIQADLNMQFTLFQQGTVRMVAFGGGNLTQLISDYTPAATTGDETIEDAHDRVFGGNLGAGLELYMSPQWDLNISTKYILSSNAQFVISVQAAWYFKKRHRAYRR